MKRFLLSLFVLSSLISVLTGCSQSKPVAPPAGKTERATSVNEHGHKPSAHGGIIIEIGQDNYHAEALFEKGGAVRLYLLGKDESKVQEIESQSISAFVKNEGDVEAVAFSLRAEPQTGDKSGMTSLFVGQLPKDFVGKRVEVTVPSITIAGERFRIAFASQAASTADGHMPTKVADAEERQLYLTPGGKYTEADIKANGNVTASEKFKGVKAQHDLKPKSGDKICPVTMTKANPNFRWIIGGKTYEFCCPPCVDEFVALAKEQPAEIKEPEEYRKK